MKPFNLEEAKQGKPVITRDGREARIICFDRDDPDYPIIGLVREGNREYLCLCTLEGHDDSLPTYDLMMKSEKKEGWINIYKDGCFTIKYKSSPMVYDTKEDALMATALCRDYYITTAKIEWEE